MQQVELCANHGGRGASTMTTIEGGDHLTVSISCSCRSQLDPNPYPSAPQSPCIVARFHQLDLPLLFSPNLSTARSRFTVLSFSCLRLQSLWLLASHSKQSIGPTPNHRLDASHHIATTSIYNSPRFPPLFPLLHEGPITSCELMNITDIPAEVKK